MKSRKLFFRLLSFLLINIAISALCGCSITTENSSIFPHIAEFDNQPQVSALPTESPVQEYQPVSGEQPVFRFVIAGDSRGLYSDELEKFRGPKGGVNTEVISEVLAAVKHLEIPPEFMVTLGDYSMGSSSPDDFKAQMKQWVDCVTEYYPIEFFYPCFGNHEASAGDESYEIAMGRFNPQNITEYFREDFYGKTIYCFKRSDCTFFILNSNSLKNNHKITDAVLEWMKVHQGSKYNFIFVHEPAFPSGNHVGSSLDAEPEQRDIYWSTIEKFPGAITFNAHEHQYARRCVDSSFNDAFKNSVFQVTTAGMGAPFHYEYTDNRGMVVDPIYEYHYVIVDVYDGYVEFTAISLSGNFLDSFRIYSSD